jgi:hypothetical protein
VQPFEWNKSMIVSRHSKIVLKLRWLRATTPTTCYMYDFAGWHRRCVNISRILQLSGLNYWAAFNTTENFIPYKHNLTVKVFALNHIALGFNGKKIISQIVTTLTIIHLKMSFDNWGEIKQLRFNLVSKTELVQLRTHKYTLPTSINSSVILFLSRIKNCHGWYDWKHMFKFNLLFCANFSILTSQIIQLLRFSHRM